MTDPTSQQPADSLKLLARAREHQRAGRRAEAEKLYRETIAAWPEAPEPHHGLGLLYARAGRVADAIEPLATALRLAPDTPLYVRHLAQACLAAGRPDEAVRVYRRAAERQPDVAEWHFNLGILLGQHDQYADAAASYRRVLAIDPAAVLAQVNLGVMLQHLGAPDEAIATLRKATLMAPASFEAHYNFAMTLAAHGRFPEAVEAFRAAISADPKIPWGHASLGHVLQELRRHDEAIACYERAIAIAPDLALAHMRLASALHEKGQMPAALDALRRALAIEPGNAKIHVNLAQTLQELGDLAGAEAAYRRALELERGLVEAQAHIAILLQKTGKTNEASRLLDYPRLLRRQRVERVEGWPDMAAFNADLARYAHGHPSLVRDPPAKATKLGSQTGEILSSGDGPLRALRAVIKQAAADYLATTGTTEKVAFPVPPPASWRLHGWAVVLRSGGHQTAHFHPTGLVSGVYYVHVPAVVKAGAAGNAGSIRFGQPMEEIFGDGIAGATDPRLTTEIRPEEGLLILFPSYFWHKTIPFESEEERISIAFDVMHGGALGGARDSAAG